MNETTEVNIMCLGKSTLYLRTKIAGSPEICDYGTLMTFLFVELLSTINDLSVLTPVQST